MRMIVISQATDLGGLRRLLFAGVKPGADADAAASAALERVQQMNPHLDLTHLAAGAVLLLPELPGLDAAAGRIAGDDAFALRGRHGDRTESRRQEPGRCGSGAGCRKPRPGKRDEHAVRARDGRCRPGTTDADRASPGTLRQDQEQVQAASATLEALRTGAADELAAIGKLSGFRRPRG